MQYHKIPSPFIRSEITKKLTREYISPEIENLANNEWIFTDKVDGTNVRIYWDGYKIEYKGRTGKAVLPQELIKVLDSLFIEELFEQKFGETPVTLYGEGFGGKIQKGTYQQTESFILFDVLIGKVFLERDNVDDIAKSLGLKSVPVLCYGTIQYGIDFIGNNYLVEGLIGVPKGNFLDRRGNRIIVKVKNKDFLNNLV